MPDKLVTTERFLTPNKEGARIVGRLKVFYRKRSDEFYVKVPTHLQTGGYSGSGQGRDRVVTPFEGEITGATPVQTIAKYRTLCDSYVKSLKKKVKVIGYTLSYQCKEDVSGFDGDGMGFTVDWLVMIEVKLPEETEYKRIGEDHEGNEVVGSYIHEKYDKIIPWTKEREDFFKLLDDAIDDLVTKAKSFLGDKKALIRMIDSKTMPLMLAAPKSKGGG